VYRRRGHRLAPRRMFAQSFMREDRLLRSTNHHRAAAADINKEGRPPWVADLLRRRQCRATVKCLVAALHRYRHAWASMLAPARASKANAVAVQPQRRTRTSPIWITRASQREC
jgi:hypothetical protein